MPGQAKAETISSASAKAVFFRVRLFAVSPASRRVFFLRRKRKGKKRKKKKETLFFLPYSALRTKLKIVLNGMLEALSRTDRVRTADRSSAPNTSENNNRNVLTVHVIRLNSHVKLFLTKSLHLPLQRRGSVRYDSNGMVGEPS